MISLSQYIKNKSFTVGGTTSHKLLIFDVDDTLINTTAKIWLMNKKGLVKKITNSEYNTYKKKPDEWFDYREFDDPRILQGETFTKYWRTLKREYHKGTHISLITARSIGCEIRDFFIKNGIDIKPELVFAVGDKDYQFSGTIQEKKAKTIELLSKLGYDTFVFFDDNEENLQTAKKLEKKLDIKIHTVKV